MLAYSRGAMAWLYNGAHLRHHGIVALRVFALVLSQFCDGAVLCHLDVSPLCHCDVAVLSRRNATYLRWFAGMPLR
jgi:hypothetical protein